MSNFPVISICIPAYKRTEFLQRLLDSIAIQSFRDFEVIVTDDSSDNSVALLLQKYEGGFKIKYQKNAVAVGSPENWNAAMRLATGKWIKIMHDDDWFAHESSLQKFVDATKNNPNTDFFFAAYCNFYSSSKEQKKVLLNSIHQSLLKKPVTLFSTNFIGPPSVVLHRNDGKYWYDKNLKWVVDIDFYMLYLAHTKPVYIPDVLINVGIHEEQVTQSSFRIRAVEIPENFYLLKKIGFAKLRNLYVYDAFWRLMRNLNISNLADIRSAGYTEEIPGAINSMLHLQNKIPNKLLKFGALSKTLMFLSFLQNRRLLPRTNAA